MRRIDQEALAFLKLVLKPLKRSVEGKYQRSDFLGNAVRRKSRPVAARFDFRCFASDLAHPQAAFPRSRHAVVGGFGASDRIPEMMGDKFQQQRFRRRRGQGREPVAKWHQALR